MLRFSVMSAFASRRQPSHSGDALYDVRQRSHKCTVEAAIRHDTMLLPGS